jgi:hypothetical protein
VVVVVVDQPETVLGLVGWLEGLAGAAQETLALHREEQETKVVILHQREIMVAVIQETPTIPEAGAVLVLLEMRAQHQAPPPLVVLGHQIVLLVRLLHMPKVVAHNKPLGQQAQPIQVTAVMHKVVLAQLDSMAALVWSLSNTQTHLQFPTPAVV